MSSERSDLLGEGRGYATLEEIIKSLDQLRSAKTVEFSVKSANARRNPNETFVENLPAMAERLDTPSVADSDATTEPENESGEEEEEEEEEQTTYFYEISYEGDLVAQTFAEQVLLPAKEGGVQITTDEMTGTDTIKVTNPEIFERIKQNAEDKGFAFELPSSNSAGTVFNYTVKLKDQEDDQSGLARLMKTANAYRDAYSESSGSSYIGNLVVLPEGAQITDADTGAWKLKEPTLALVMKTDRISTYVVPVFQRAPVERRERTGSSRPGRFGVGRQWQEVEKTGETAYFGFENAGGSWFQTYISDIDTLRKEVSAKKTVLKWEKLYEFLKTEAAAKEMAQNQLTKDAESVSQVDVSSSSIRRRLTFSSGEDEDAGDEGSQSDIDSADNSDSDNLDGFSDDQDADDQDADDQDADDEDAEGSGGTGPASDNGALGKKRDEKLENSKKTFEEKTKALRDEANAWTTKLSAEIAALEEKNKELDQLYDAGYDAVKDKLDASQRAELEPLQTAFKKAEEDYEKKFNTDTKNKEGKVDFVECLKDDSGRRYATVDGSVFVFDPLPEAERHPDDPKGTWEYKSGQRTKKKTGEKGSRWRIVRFTPSQDYEYKYLHTQDRDFWGDDENPNEDKNGTRMQEGQRGTWEQGKPITFRTHGALKDGIVEGNNAAKRGQPKKWKTPPVKISALASWFGNVRNYFQEPKVAAKRALEAAKKTHAKAQGELTQKFSAALKTKKILRAKIKKKIKKKQQQAEVVVARLKAGIAAEAEKQSKRDQKALNTYDKAVEAKATQIRDAAKRKADRERARQQKLATEKASKIAATIAATKAKILKEYPPLTKLTSPDEQTQKELLMGTIGSGTTPVLRFQLGMSLERPYRTQGEVKTSKMTVVARGLNEQKKECVDVRYDNYLNWKTWSGKSKNKKLYEGDLLVARYELNNRLSKKSGYRYEVGTNISVSGGTKKPPSDKIRANWAEDVTDDLVITFEKGRTYFVYNDANKKDSYDITLYKFKGITQDDEGYDDYVFETGTGGEIRAGGIGDDIYEKCQVLRSETVIESRNTIEMLEAKRIRSTRRKDISEVVEKWQEHGLGKYTREQAIDFKKYQMALTIQKKTSFESVEGEEAHQFGKEKADTEFWNKAIEILRDSSITLNRSKTPFVFYFESVCEDLKKSLAKTLSDAEFKDAAYSGEIKLSYLTKKARENWVKLGKADKKKFVDQSKADKAEKAVPKNKFQSRFTNFVKTLPDYDLEAAQTVYNIWLQVDRLDKWLEESLGGDRGDEIKRIFQICGKLWMHLRKEWYKEAMKVVLKEIQSKAEQAREVEKYTKEQAEKQLKKDEAEMADFIVSDEDLDGDSSSSEKSDNSSGSSGFSDDEDIFG